MGWEKDGEDVRRKEARESVRRGQKKR